MNIGIVIPTYKDHWNKTKKLLLYLNDNIIKPDCISVSCSSSNDQILDESEHLKKALDIEILFSFSDEKMGAWLNRNIAAEKLNTDIISFFDGDDIPHPQRTEILKICFENNNDVDVIVHDYHYQESFINTSIFEEIQILKLKFYKNLINDSDNNKQHPVFNEVFSCPVSTVTYHNAHVSIRKKLFEIVKYKNLPYVEDSVFNAELIKAGYPLSYLNHKLSIYSKFTNI